MTQSNNPIRENRILEAAAQLFIHYGFDKTTVSDVAKQAGVSKGAIYLHFDSKDELFEALMHREVMAYQERWLDLLDADPLGGTIGAMYKNVLVALSGSPFMSAIFRQDGRILGSYLHKPEGLFKKQNQSIRYEFVKMMQDAGAMRQDIDPQVTAHIMNMLAYGLVAIQEIIDQEHIPPTDEVINGIAEMMDRAFTPEDGGNSEAGKAIVRQISDAARQAFEEAKTK
ncbi:MAG: helix-turn-helix domain-containing protein [Chloroflexota bacterium]